MKKVILLFVHIPTHFREMIRVAEILNKTERYKPFILFNAQYDEMKVDIDKLIKLNIPYLEIDKDNTAQNKDNKSKSINNPKRSTSSKHLKFTANLAIKFIKLLQFNIPKIFNKIVSKLKLDSLSQKVITLLFRIIFSTNSRILLSLSRRIILKSFGIYLTSDKVKNSQFKTKYKYFLNNLFHFLKAQEIKLIILPEHNLIYLTHLLVLIGKKLNIPSIIVPFTIANTTEWLETFVNEPQYHLDKHFLNEISAGLFPNWVRNYKDQQLILPPALIFLHEMHKITPNNPWLINSGDVDFLATESQAMKHYYIQAGIDPKQLRITGALYNDALFQQLQNADINKKLLLESLGIQCNKPIIVCALPPDQLSNRKQFVEFNDYESIVRAFIETLSMYSENYHVIINLHPRTPLQDVPYINEYPVYLSNKNIADLIPLCDLFVASCSATIRMAISCAIPVINYDLYRYNYDDYREVGGVITMDKYNVYNEEINKILTDISYYDKYKSAQNVESEKWGKPDGLSGKNLIKEIELLLEPNN